MTEIKLLKLQNGEELIGKFISDNGEYLTLSHVRALVLGQGNGGQMAVQMIPWFLTIEDGSVRIKNSMIMSEPTGVLPKALEDGYLQQVSGLQIVQGA